MQITANAYTNQYSFCQETESIKYFFIFIKRISISEFIVITPYVSKEFIYSFFSSAEEFEYEKAVDIWELEKGHPISLKDYELITKIYSPTRVFVRKHANVVNFADAIFDEMTEKNQFKPPIYYKLDIDVPNQMNGGNELASTVAEGLGQAIIEVGIKALLKKH